MGLLNKNVKNVGRSLSNFNNFFGAAFGVLGVRQISRFSDEIQILRDRIRVFSVDSEEALSTFNSLIQAAQFTNTSVASLAESYNRLALATKDLGLSNEAILATTVALQQTFRISGSTIAETTASVVQLSQGLSAGALRGQELRSVLEQNALLAGLLAEEFGVARGQLIKLAETGAITSQRVFKVLAENFDELNKQAAQIAPTLGQSATIALDQFKIKLEETIRSLGIAGGFNDLVLLASRNVDVLTDSLASLAIAFTALKVSSFVAGAGGISGALTKIAAAASSATVVVGGFVAAVAFLFFASERTLTKVSLGFEKVKLIVEKALLGATIAVGEFIDKLGILGSLGIFSGAFTATARVTLGAVEERLSSVNDQLDEIAKTSDREGLASILERARKELLAFSQTADSTSKVVEKSRFKELNEEFRKGTLSIQEYREEVDQINIAKVNRDFDKGTITLDQYNQQLAKIKDSGSDAEEALRGVQVAVNDINNQAGTLSTNIADGIKSVFSNLKDVLVDFVRKGEFEFEKFTNAVLDDLTRIIIRASIIGPLANAILGDFGGGGGAAAAGQSAGAAAPAGFSSATPQFADGGIFNSPQLGIFGEAGPEAVVPLKRGSNGKLGISAEGGLGGSNVNVNVFNNSETQATVSETQGPNGERNIDVLIENKVNEAIGSGKFDRALNQSFGMNRRGV